jgi:iron uptake system EfeUOB component EfeO/EfeM
MEHKAMNELQAKIDSVIQILASDLSKANKLIAALQTLSGTDITHLSSQKKQCIYRQMNTSNKIIARYPTIKDYDDYAIISDADLNKLLKSVEQLCFKLLNE